MPFGTFRLITPDDLTHRKALPLVAPTPPALSLLDPDNPDCLEQGEWVVPTADGYARYDAVDAGPQIAWPKAAPKGSTDEQALGKMESYYAGDWRAWTTSYDPSGTYVIDTPLKVALKDVDTGAATVNRSVLTNVTDNNDRVQAVCEEPPANALEFDPMLIRVARFVHGV
jgi:hypothetical protein